MNTRNEGNETGSREIVTFATHQGTRANQCWHKPDNTHLRPEGQNEHERIPINGNNPNMPGNSMQRNNKPQGQIMKE